MHGLFEHDHFLHMYLEANSTSASSINLSTGDFILHIDINFLLKQGITLHSFQGPCPSSCCCSTANDKNQGNVQGIRLALHCVVIAFSNFKMQGALLIVDTHVVIIICTS